MPNLITSINNLAFSINSSVDVDGPAHRIYNQHNIFGRRTSRGDQLAIKNGLLVHLLITQGDNHLLLGQCKRSGAANGFPPQKHSRPHVLHQTTCWAFEWHGGCALDFVMSFVCARLSLLSAPRDAN